MGAFNTVTGEVECPICSKVGTFTIQFKYGEKWQHAYHIGDLLKWGVNEEGRKDARLALVLGISEHGCPSCHAGDNYAEDRVELWFCLLIENNRLKALFPYYPFRDNLWQDGFFILD